MSSWSIVKVGLALGCLALGALASACGGVGSCASSGGLVDECKQDWSKSECEDWNSQQVNGASWSYSSDSCDERGFSVSCADGSYVRASSDC